MSAEQESAVAAELTVMCVWHQELVPISEALMNNGSCWKCRPCYNAERGLQQAYKAKARGHVWRGMSTDERREEIKKHRQTSQSRGKKRTYEVKESTKVTDSMGAKASKPYMNRRQLLDFRSMLCNFTVVSLIHCCSCRDMLCCKRLQLQIANVSVVQCIVGLKKLL